MWNFVGRQNDIYAPASNVYNGNWESGIKPLDNARLGDQSSAPEWVRNNKGKNHYFFLPLLLGILGLVFQFDKDRRGCWLTFLLFFMTGIAIVIYLNQQPYQVRERDYAYAGSFYAFSIWVGFAVAALYSLISKWKKGTAVAVAATVACLCVPALMAEENWDDHDRSHRYTSVETAKNYLNSVGQNGLLITHGDNDTFPLWYVQEVEGFRTDVRICNTSLLGTDWYIDQMKYTCNKSPRLDLQIGQEQYLYGVNDWIYIQESDDNAYLLSDIVKVFKHPQAKLTLQDGRRLDYWAARKMIVPVNKENCLKYGIVSEKFADQIPDSIVLEIPKSKNYLTKPELFVLDFLSTYKWDRPLNVLSNGGDLNIGLKDYLMFDGYSSKFVPIKNTVRSMSAGIVDTDELYDMIKNRFSFTATSRKDYYIDYQNLYTNMGVMSIRNLFLTASNSFLEAGQNGRAEEMLDMVQTIMDPERYPYDNMILGWNSNALFPIYMISNYYKLGRNEKARKLADVLEGQLLQSVKFYFSMYDISKNDFEYACYLIYYLSDTMKKGGDEEYAAVVEKRLSDYLASETSASAMQSSSRDSTGD